ncbi:hypothetical protein [Halosimplex amylolyticum]|uniref:hypothetical protein n=1 Tax=Halosimplex amylolyticum TaxID=3396616 RepID=UPI003F56E2BF
MYSLRQVRKGVKRGLENPSYFAREANRIFHRQLGSWEYNLNGVDIVKEDWDTLVILDACRYDTFASRHQLEGVLESRESSGSHTVEFLQANFADGRFPDTVYVTASPQLYRNADWLNASFHSVINVWREAGWNDDYGTVLPETTTDYALDAHEAYPNKRHIVHYLQPHYPFVGSESALDARQFGNGEHEGDIWEQLMRGTTDLDSEQIWRAYEQNLDLVLDAVEPLVSSIEGRTVITADHGNMIGERATPIPIHEWGHPPGLYTEELVTVPWLVSESGSRRCVVAGESDSAERGDSADETIEEATVEDRLQDLGYV